MSWFQPIHEKALSCSRKYRRSEYALLLAIQAVDAKRVYLKYGHSSLFEYCVQALKLTEATSYAFINVSRKSLKMPQIKEAISEGKLSVSQAKRVMSVITPKTQEIWLEKAATLTQRALDKEVVKHNPKEAVKEKIRPVSPQRASLQCGLSPELERKLQRAKEVLSQKKRHSCSYEEVLEAALSLYLEKEDPVEKAKKKPTKVQKLPQASPSRKIPAPLQRAVYLKHAGQCSFSREGKRCSNKAFIDIHHIKPLSQGGTHALSNLTLLCRGHHQMVHEHKDSTLLKTSADVPPTWSITNANHNFSSVNPT